ncbi:MAG: hypothetical protein II757_01275 [Bacteroidales bacterium]|nr:hypothetical protein [Bacteroidales bacterium]MCR5115774.1 hypothetical protein [Bacteroidales bacterium]
MKRHFRLYLVILGFLALWFFQACAPKITGARPHRRDRHCGCDNTLPTPADSTCILYQNLSSR